MKLASALWERADLQKKLFQLEVRLANNARVQEGEEPAEAPDELLAELNRTIDRLEELITRINLTNSNTRHNGKTITELLAHRDCLNWKIQKLQQFRDQASAKVARATHSEIKIFSTVSVSALQKQIDALCKEKRECEDQLQELNWTTELL